MKFLDIEIDEKLFKKIIIGCVIFIVIYMAFTMSSLLIFKSYTLGPNTSVNDEDINTHIDVLEISRKKLEIAGWAYKEGEKIEKVNCSYVIKNQDTGKMYLMRTKMEKNKNISDEGYEDAGIHAQCLLFGIPKGKYQILVLYRNNNEDILADTLIPFEIK